MTEAAMPSYMASSARAEAQPTQAAETAPPIVSISGVRKEYHGTVAVEHLDMDIRQGEFFTLLGPSGSGKTTTLRMISGFERPSDGRIEVDGMDVTRIPPFQRDTNTVFQDYALFPHMSVIKNLAYGLEAKRLPRSEIKERVDDALRMVRLERYAKQLPSQLSGGQKQRVALARAIINRPRVLLLDEPLGALDLKLRQKMQFELKHIQEQVQITFIYVTHDQEEALIMSDRIAVFNQGRIEQLGGAAELYERPANEFVANFLGTSNLIDLDGVRVMIRPERILVLSDDQTLDENVWRTQPGVVKERAFLGPFTRYVVRLEDGTELTVFDQNTDGFAASARNEHGTNVRIAWQHASVYCIPEK